MASVFQRVPPLHLLIAFEAAARLGSFARAAEELSVTPSAVSHRIKNLEELWGEDLFVRSNAALRLTAAGTRYQRNVQDALKSLNELARPEYNKMRTRLRVAIPPTFGRQHLVPRLPEFGALYPHIDLELHLAIPFLDVKAEDTDVEIRYGTGRYPDLKTTRLLVEPVFPACGREYYDRINGRTIARPEDLHNLVLLRSRWNRGGRGSRPPGSTGRSRRPGPSSTISACCWRQSPPTRAWRWCASAWRASGCRRAP